MPTNDAWPPAGASRSSRDVPSMVALMGARQTHVERLREVVELHRRSEMEGSDRHAVDDGSTDGSSAARSIA